MAYRVSYLGNFSTPASTESHVGKSLESLGHLVQRIQEGDVPATKIAGLVKLFRSDVFLHTQTRGLAITGGTDDERLTMLNDIKSLGIPTVAYHLDLFLPLDRAEYVHTDPYFQADYFFSTDGGHDEEWKRLGINHVWLPPGVFHEEAYDGTPDPRFFCDVAFVGSWKSYAHQEHQPVRREMLRLLQRKYGRRFRMFPRGPAIRGKELTDLYASVKVVVGDSCLAGKVKGYVSDRVPETMGRGALLVHPHVEGLEDVFPYLVTYPAGDWRAMFNCIYHYLANDLERETQRRLAAEHTREHHSYRNRMQTVLDTVLK